MSFWSNVGRNVGNFFGGIFGGNRRRREEDEAQSNFRAPSRRPTQQTSRTPQGQSGFQEYSEPIRTQRPENIFEDLNNSLRLPGAQEKPTVNPNVGAKTMELEKLYQANLDQAREDAKRQSDAAAPKDALGKFWRMTGLDGNRQTTRNAAETMARNRASQQFQDKYGWNKDSEVVDYNKRTTRIANQGSQDARQRIQNTQNTVNTMRYLPGAGIGELGANAIRGNFAGTPEADNRLLQEQMELTPQQIAELSPEDRSKFLMFAKAGLGAGLLDLVGFGAGSVVKNVVRGGVKNAVRNTARNSARNVARNLASREGAKIVTQNALIGGGAGSLIGGGGAALMGADPEAILQAAARGFGGGMLGGAASSPFDIAARSVRPGSIKTVVRAGANLGDAVDNVDAATKTALRAQQPRPIDVSDASGEMAGVPVRVEPTNKPTRPIVEVTGDTPGQNRVKVPTPEERFAAQPAAHPDRRIEGVSPFDTGNTGSFTRAEINAEKTALDDALRAGEIDNETYKVANEQLSQLGAIDDAPKGAKINVKSVRDIPVVDKTEVPTGLPETPGTVRATESTDPTSARSAAVASEQSVRLPREVQRVLDNPKQFNKRQVAAARNQRKLARQMAKTQEETAEAMARVEAASPVSRQEAPIRGTGELGKSQGKLARGQVYEKTSRAAAREQGTEGAANTSYERFISETGNKSTVTARDRDIALELQSRQKPGSPEHRRLGEIANKADTQAAQTMATIPREVRRTASAEKLTNSFANKLYRHIEEGSTPSESDFRSIEVQNQKFVAARDSYNKALEDFNTNPSESNMNRFIEARKEFMDSDKATKFNEYNIASKLAKNDKTPGARKFVQDLESEAGVYTMDYADANLLSSTRVMLNNYLNTLGVGLEESAFGRLGARVATARTGEVIGGGSREGRKIGKRLGSESVVEDAILRSRASGNPALRTMKNIVTTGNTLGERNIQGNVRSAVFDEYKQKLRQAGYTGKELNRRARVQTLADPEGLAPRHMEQALINNSLASTSSIKSAKIESILTNKLSDKMGNSTAARNVAKLITRVGVGFPTVILRAAQGGLRRSALGIPSVIQGEKAIRAGNRAKAAMHYKNAVKELGSGGAMMGVGLALGLDGRISLGYPPASEPDARKEWQREGKSEYSIKIGDNWYNLPSALGVFAMPLMLGAQAGQNSRDGKPMTDGIIRSTLTTLIDSTPVSSFETVPKLLSDYTAGRDTSGQVSRIAASMVRAGTPLGSFVNQVAKMFDPTANDTTQGDALAQFMAKVQDGIPGLANSLPSREVDGQEIRNPSPIARLFGAVSAEQKAGVEKTEQIRGEVKSATDKIREYGGFDEGLRANLSDEKKSWFDKAEAGEELTETQLKQLTSDLVKGVSPAGTDTAYLEREQYDTHLAALKIKRDLMEADPTTRPSNVEKMDVAITRGEIYRDNKIPYDLIKDYQSTSLTEWRNMGNPEHEDYNPELYQKLWAMDEKMTEAGVSYRKDALDKQKFYAKEPRKGRAGGRGSGRGSRFGGDFGRLKAGTGAPNVQQYETIQRQAGSVPVIQVKRPNIVHKIGFSG